MLTNNKYESTMNNIKNSETTINLKWDVQKRMTLLESTVYWSDGLRTNSLVETFGISRVQASKDLSLYREMCPNNIRYDKHKKRYLVTDQFVPRFIEGSVSEYLEMLKSSGSEEKNPVVSLIDNAPPVCVVQPVQQSLSSNILQKISESILRGKELEIVYRTMSRLKTIKHLLCPHIVVHDGMHWYVRAYSYNHEDYKNFLLARIFDAKTMGKADIDPSGDKAWQTRVKVKLGLNPRLTSAQKAVVEADYGMRNGTLSYPTRAALVPLFLNSMHIRTDDTASDPASDPVILLNREELDRYLTV